MGLLKKLLRSLCSDRLRMKRLAHHYAERAMMNGVVVRKTGEVIPRDSA